MSVLIALAALIVSLAALLGPGYRQSWAARWGTSVR